MTIEQKIARIIEDMCSADPSLHSREAELRPIVRAVLEAQPDTGFDEGFSARVRKQVLAEAAKGRPAKPSFMDRLRHLRRGDAYVLGTAALGIVLAASLATSVLVAPRGGNAPALTHVAPSSSFAPKREGELSVVPLGGGAFGQLQGFEAQPPAENTGLSGAGAATPGAPPDLADRAMLAPQPGEATQPRYVYKGDLPATDAKVTVYRRVKGFSGASASAVAAATRGTVDLTKLENPKLQSFSLVDDRDFGYNIFVDAHEGTVTFGQLWQKWPHPDALCQDEACFRRLQLRPEQMPPADEIEAVAERFLADYGISKEGYGAPEVRDERSRAIALAGGDASLAVLPESVPVIYPIVIDGLKVHEQNGEAAGLLVGVNIRAKRVDNVWGIASNAFESSSYDAETDTAKLRAYLEKGGMPAAVPGAKVVDVPLSEPSKVLMRVWNYDQEGGSEELFVPALLFPVAEPPKDDPWAPGAVVVPLAKGLLGQDQPSVMPLEKPLTR
jgi:hypothetical protein